MIKANCMTCKHRSHDAERLMVCNKVYGGLACWHCKRIQSPIDYAWMSGGMRCRACAEDQLPLQRNDWREGYLCQTVEKQDGVITHITPIPCCPGWEAEEVQVVKVERQRGLFDA